MIVSRRAIDCHAVRPRAERHSNRDRPFRLQLQAELARPETRQPPVRLPAGFLRRVDLPFVVDAGRFLFRDDVRVGLFEDAADGLFAFSRDGGTAPRTGAAILAHAGLDEAALGYSNESTYAGASVTDRRIQKQMVQPDQRLIASWLTEAVLRPFSDSAGEEYRAAFVNQDAMEDPAEKRANIVAIADDLSQNERRQAMGFEPYEHELADIPTRLIPFVADEEEYPQLASGGMDGGDAPDKTDTPATEYEQVEDDPPEPTDDAEKSLQPRFSLNGHAGHD